MHLQAPPASAISAFLLLVIAAATIVLTCPCSKCAAYTLSAITGFAAASTLGTTHCPEGLVAVGMPLGSDDFVEADGPGPPVSWALSPSTYSSPLRSGTRSSCFVYPFKPFSPTSLASPPGRGSSPMPLRPNCMRVLTLSICWRTLFLPTYLFPFCHLQKALSLPSNWGLRH
jgi:hypothetical protein